MSKRLLYAVVRQLFLLAFAMPTSKASDTTGITAPAALYDSRVARVDYPLYSQNDTGLSGLNRLMIRPEIYSRGQDELFPR